VATHRSVLPAGIDSGLRGRGDRAQPGGAVRRRGDGAGRSRSMAAGYAVRSIRGWCDQELNPHRRGRCCPLRRTLRRPCRGCGRRRGPTPPQSPCSPWTRLAIPAAPVRRLWTILGRAQRDVAIYDPYGWYQISHASETKIELDDQLVGQVGQVMDVVGAASTGIPATTLGSVA